MLQFSNSSTIFFHKTSFSKKIGQNVVLEMNESQRKCFHRQVRNTTFNMSKNQIEQNILNRMF